MSVIMEENSGAGLGKVVGYAQPLTPEEEKKVDEMVARSLKMPFD